MPLVRSSWCDRVGTSEDPQPTDKLEELTSDRPRLEELIYLYEKLSPEERDELLQCLLISAPRGGEAMIKASSGGMLVIAIRRLRPTRITPVTEIKRPGRWERVKSGDALIRGQV